MSRVELNEVVSRDGLQNESTHLATADKVRLADALSPLGFARLEASSFTSPKAIPALAGADEVLARIARPDGLIVTAPVPNRRGAGVRRDQRARARAGGGRDSAGLSGRDEAGRTGRRQGDATGRETTPGCRMRVAPSLSSVT